MTSCPARRGVSKTVVTVVRRKLGAPFTKPKLTCSDCERLTTSKSLNSGSCRSACSPLEVKVAVICKVRVPSSATSSASARADSCTSSAAPAARAQSRMASALPVLLDIRSTLLRFLLPESPDLQVLLPRAQGVEEALRLAPIHRTAACRLHFLLLPCLVRLRPRRGLRLLLPLSFLRLLLPLLLRLLVVACL